MNHVCCSELVVFLFIVNLRMALHVGSSFFLFGMSVSFGFVGVRGAFSFEFCMCDILPLSVIFLFSLISRKEKDTVGEKQELSCLSF